MTLDYRVGDVFDRLAEIPDASIDLIVTSPPFLALRSYLPADHPDKAKEIGSEPTPAEFIDTLLALTAEWGRVLAPHGSICVELGDTFAGGKTTAVDAPQDEESGGMKFARIPSDGRPPIRNMNAKVQGGGAGWPLAKSLTGIPTLYPWSLAYGRNLLTGNESPAGQWRIRNVIVWARPNPPVGALGDKFRPATSYITVACRGHKRYFDLDAVRTTYDGEPPVRPQNAALGHSLTKGNTMIDGKMMHSNPAGAPPLDWHADDHPEDGDWLWKLSTQPYKGSHYATYPLTLPKRMIKAMCPLRVCTTCGKPSERIVGDAVYTQTRNGRNPATLDKRDGIRSAPGVNQFDTKGDSSVKRSAPTIGFTDCGCPCVTCLNGEYPIWDHSDNETECPDCDGTGAHQWRTGVVLDPFAGSGTTLEAAQAVGRHAIGIDIDERNAHLAQSRVGMFLNIDAA